MNFPAANASTDVTGTCNSGYSVFVGNIPSATTFPMATCSLNGDEKTASWSPIMISCDRNQEIKIKE